MYLFREDCPNSAGVRDVNGADDAHIVYHEYTHGLSNRLVTDAAGFGALDGAQSGSMGEAWSDFYAEDYLAAAGFQTDTPAPGEIRSSTYVNAAHSHPALRLRRGLGRARLPGLARSRARRLHLRRLRKDHRIPRGACRRRDLGRGALGPAPSADRRARAAGRRLPRSRSGDRRHAPVAAGDPPSSRCETRFCRPTSTAALWTVIESGRCSRRAGWA